MTAYCVVCRGPAADLMQKRRTIRFYLSAASADKALVAALKEYPEFRVLGIEPRDHNATAA